MNNPIISIVMPVFNNEKYFPLAVKSVLNQDVEEIELVIIDDGSTDNTSTIADEFANADPRVKVIHQENKWIYASFNEGIKLAKGEYIYIVNSDDEIKANAISKLIELIGLYNHPDIIWCGIDDYYCDRDLNTAKQITIRKWNSQIYYCSKVDDSPQILIDLIKAGFFRDQANVYKREMMLECPFRNDFYAADTFFNYTIATRINNFLVFNESIYIHHIFDDFNMNIANKKYMGYEHYMFNELYCQAIVMLKERHINTFDNIEFFTSKRRKEVSIQVRRLLHDNTYKSIQNRLDEVFLTPFDEIIEECFKRDREELEARILAELRMYFIEVGEINHFSYELVETLLKYEHDAEDYKKLEECVYCDKNPNAIGGIFFNKLISN